MELKEQWLIAVVNYGSRVCKELYMVKCIKWPRRCCYMWSHQRWGGSHWRCNCARDFTRGLSCIIYHKNSGEFIKRFVKYTNRMPCHWQNIFWKHTYFGNYRHYTTTRYIRISRKDNIIYHIPNIRLYINVNCRRAAGVSLWCIHLCEFYIYYLYFSFVRKFVDNAKDVSVVVVLVVCF